MVTERLFFKELPENLPRDQHVNHLFRNTIDLAWLLITEFLFTITILHFVILLFPIHFHIVLDQMKHAEIAS